LLAEFRVFRPNLKRLIVFSASLMWLLTPAFELFDPVNGAIVALASRADHGQGDSGRQSPSMFLPFLRILPHSRIVGLVQPSVTKTNRASSWD
jgi:hypothetical protein